MEGIYLLLGSNLGDRALNLIRALKKIVDFDIKIIKKSSVYQTAAWGNPAQQDFLNQVIQVESSDKPHELLKNILSIEQQLGRVRKEKWGDRLIDIDILYFNDLVFNEHHLKIPHPEIPNRRFTLAPLVEISPNFQHPILKCSNTYLLENCQDELEVVLYKN